MHLVRFCHGILPLILLHSQLANAAPFPANDPGARPEDAPLPGRTDKQVLKGGKNIVGYEGDDWMPEHMRHTQDTIQKFPGNGDFHPYRPDAPQNRNQRLKGIPEAGIHPVTKEPLVNDEKTLASQNNPKQQTDTTVRKLPHYESGGKYSIPEEERRKKYEEVHGKGSYHSPKMPDGSFKTENALTGSMQSSAKQFEKEHQSQRAHLQLKPNPGWLPLDESQRRAHEAPARLPSQISKEEENGRKQPVDKGKQPAQQPGQGQGSGSGSSSPSPPSPPPPTPPKTLPQPAGGGRTLRSHSKPGSSVQPPPPSNPGGSSRRKPGQSKNDPNNYLFPEKKIENTYRPVPLKDKDGKIQGTPGIAPPSERESLGRQPPRPQNREHWEKQKAENGGNWPPPPPKPLPPPITEQKQPPRKPQKDGPTGKEGTSHEAPANLPTQPKEGKGKQPADRPSGGGGDDDKKPKPPPPGPPGPPKKDPPGSSGPPKKDDTPKKPRPGGGGGPGTPSRIPLRTKNNTPGNTRRPANANKDKPTMKNNNPLTPPPSPNKKKTPQPPSQAPKSPLTPPPSPKQPPKVNIKPPGSRLPVPIKKKPTNQPAATKEKSPPTPPTANKAPPKAPAPKVEKKPPMLTPNKKAPPKQAPPKQQPPKAEKKPPTPTPNKKAPPPQKAPPKQAPPKKAAPKQAPPKKAPLPQKAPPKQAPKKAPPKQAPPKKAPPPQKAPPKQAPPKKAPPPQKAPPKQAPPKKAPPPQKAPLKQAPPKQAPPKKAPPPQKAPPKQAPPQKAPQKQAPPKKAPPPKQAPPQKAPPKQQPPKISPPKVVKKPSAPKITAPKVLPKPKGGLLKGASRLSKIF